MTCQNRDTSDDGMITHVMAVESNGHTKCGFVLR